MRSRFGQEGRPQNTAATKASQRPYPLQGSRPLYQAYSARTNGPYRSFGRAGTALPDLPKYRYRRGILFSSEPRPLGRAGVRAG